MVRAREINRAIERRGGRLLRQVGSHRRYEVRYVSPDGAAARCVTIVAQHPGDVPTGTLYKIGKNLESAFGRRWLTQ